MSSDQEVPRFDSRHWSRNVYNPLVDLKEYILLQRFMFSVCILFLLLHNMMNSYDPDVLHSLTEIISQILISCQSTTCNVLLRCNTSSSIILKQKYYLRWSKNRKMQFSCGEIYGRLLFLLISCLQECVR